MKLIYQHLLRMAGDDLDPFQIKGNLSVKVHPTDPNEFGDGSVDIDGNINIDGTIGENTALNGFNIKDLKYLTIKEQTAGSTPSSNEHIYYQDSSTALLRSKDSSNVITTYQPTNAKGDVLTHNGTTQVKLPVSTDDYVLTCDSSVPNGIIWKPVLPDLNNDADPTKSNYIDILNNESISISNTYQDIPFKYERVKDTIFDHFLFASEEVIFRYTSNYVLFLNLNTQTVTNNNDDTLCSFRIMLDSGSGYSELPGSQGFVFNDKSLATGCNNAAITICRNFNVDDKIKVQIRKDNNSNNDIEIPVNGVEFSIFFLRVDYELDTTEYFSSYNSSSTALTGTLSPITFDTNRVLDSIYTYTSNELTLSESGLYWIIFNVSTDVSSSTAVTQFALAANTGSGYNVINETKTFLNNNASPLGCNTSLCTYIYNATANDKLQIHANQYAGTNISTVINGCNFVVIKLKSTSGQASVKYLHMTDNTAGLSIPAAFVDIPFDTEVIKDSVFLHSGASPEMTINDDGKYLIMTKFNGDLSTQNQNASIQTRLLADIGNGYFEIKGAHSCSHHESSNRGEDSHNVVGLFLFRTNTKVKMQATLLGGNTNTVSLLYSSIQIIRFEDAILNTDSVIKFGSNLHYEESLLVTSTSANSYIQKVVLTTDIIPNGLYRLDFYYIYKTTNNKTIQIQVVINSFDVIHDVIESSNINSLSQSRHGFAHIFLAQGINNATLNFKSNDNSQVSLENAKMSLWRIA